MIDRDEVLRRTDLTDLLTTLSGQAPARLGPSARWHCIAPDHNDLHPSVSVFTGRDGIQRWRCWSGGHGGTAIDALVTARPMTVAEALDHLARAARLEPAASRVERPVPVVASAPAPALLEYVAACERILWTRSGRPVLDYLVEERCLPPDLLRVNHVGADPGSALLRRPRGLPRGGVAVVLPALDPDGQVVYAQARYLEPPPGRSKYDNPAASLAPNPKLAWTKGGPQHGPLWVCEGVIDALSATVLGHDAVAVLGVSHVGPRLARQLTALQRPIVIAFDPDDAGRVASERLKQTLAERVGCTSRNDSADLNGALVERSRHTLTR